MQPNSIPSLSLPRSCALCSSRLLPLSPLTAQSHRRLALFLAPTPALSLTLSLAPLPLLHAKHVNFCVYFLIFSQLSASVGVCFYCGSRQLLLLLPPFGAFVFLYRMCGPLFFLWALLCFVLFGSIHTEFRGFRYSGRNYANCFPFTIDSWQCE